MYDFFKSMTVCTRAHWNLFSSVCMCAFVSASATRACASVCVCERERERERVRVFEIFDMSALKMDLPPIEKGYGLISIKSVSVSVSLSTATVTQFPLSFHIR